jgi:hypothetical protein
MYTHIAEVAKSQKSLTLFRASDGMLIGQAVNNTVIYGDQPNRRESHGFIDNEHAIRWLTETYARQDCGTEPVIDYRDLEALIFMPEGLQEPLKTSGIIKTRRQ